MTSPTSPILLKKTEVCERLSLSARSLEGMVKAGTFPPAVRMGKHVCPMLSADFSSFASTKRPLVTSHTRPGPAVQHRRAGGSKVPEAVA